MRETECMVRIQQVKDTIKLNLHGSSDKSLIQYDLQRTEVLR